MKDIVLIPTYMRPEYLWLTLEHLANTTSTPSDKEFWICADNRENDEYRHKIELEWQADVLAKWKAVLPLKFYKGSAHNYNGNSFNVLESYKRAFDTDARYVYLVEDDVLVTPDFFRWHEAVAEVEPDADCSLAYRCSRNHEAFKDVLDPAAYFTTARDYASIGVRWSRVALEPLFEHARKEYYENQDAYIGRRFAGNRFATDFCEQDGLIMRVLWEHRGFTVWPYVPRCYHMGWYGYHRPNGKRPNGFLDAKISQLRATISDAEQLKIVAPDYGDIEPYPRFFVAKTDAPLVKLQHFD